MDKYRNFSELKRHEIEGIDYHIQVRKGSSGIAIIAPHGGGIEPGTVDIADQVAGKKHSFYCFKGTKKTGNADLHITSDKFDEPLALRIAEEADCVLTIHGCSGTEEVIFIGGKDIELKECLLDAMTQAGFTVRPTPRPGLEGEKPENICNRGRFGRGCQIELSEGLRMKMFDNLGCNLERRKKEAFFNFVAALRKALGSCLDAMNPVHQV